MAVTAPISQPIACIPGAIEPAQRSAHLALAKLLFAQLAQSREQLPDGYAFEFAPEALTDIAQFVANERKCCPFMQFDISIAPSGGSVWLRMTGPEGTRAVLDAELGLNACSTNGCGCHGS